MAGRGRAPRASRRDRLRRDRAAGPARHLHRLGAATVLSGGVPPARAVLFDAAGTLIELAEPVGETYARIAARHGARIAPWRLGDAFRRVLRRAPPLIFPGLDAEAVAVREREAWRRIVHQTLRAADSAEASRLRDERACAEALFEAYARGRAWRARPGAAEALAALRATGFRLAVLSNFDLRLHRILDELGLAAALDRILLPSELGLAKPDRRAFLAALEALGSAPERAVFVGDDPALDLDPARAAGLRAIDAASLATLADLPRRIQVSHPEGTSPA